MEDQLKGMEDHLRKEGEQLEIENEHQKTKLEEFQQEQISERERQLKNEDQLKERNKKLCSEERREMQLETIKRLEDEINLQTKLIEHLTKMKQEKEEEMKRDEKRMKDQALQIERNCKMLTTQEEKLQMLETEIQNMKKQTQKDKQQLLTEKQWIEDEREALKRQWTEIENENNKIQKHEVANREEIDRQEMEKWENAEEIKTQTAMLQKLKEEMNECEKTLQKQKDMKQINEREIEQQINQFVEQKTKINTQKEEIDRQDLEKQKNAEEIKAQTALLCNLKKKMNKCEEALQRQRNIKQINDSETERQIGLLKEQDIRINIQKEEIDRQEMEKWKKAEELKAQTALAQKLKADMKKCEDTLQKQKTMKHIYEREIERQISQLQEQKTKIHTEKEEIEKQKREIQTNRDILNKTRSKKEILEMNIQIAGKELQIKNEKIEEKFNKLEKQKELHEQTVTVMKLEAEQNKYREIRRREEDLHILQDIHDQLDNNLSSSSYMQDCDTEWDLREELGQIIEKMKTELQKSSEELEQLKQTREQTEKRKEQERSTNDEQGDARRDAAGTSDEATKEQNVVSTQSEDGPKKEELSIKLWDLIYRLNLSNFYPQKLTTADVLSISRTSFQREKKNPLKEEDLVFAYLNKLFALDYRTRSMTLSRDSVTNDMVEMFDLDKENECNNNNTFENTQIHPMDVHMAVFHCADSFLRQNMVTKLSSCQYALPLLVPSPTSTDIELPLWTFRQIKKTWKSVGGLSTSLPVCRIKAPMVFFCRLGSVSTSKSQLLNSVINPKHDTFFHRDSPGSSRNREFMEGLVEIAWYCPAGNSDDLFNECISFCNLHGDAVEHSTQTDFLTEQATVVVFLMQDMKPNEKAREFLQKLHRDSSKYLICVISDLQMCPLLGSGNKITVGLTDRNQPPLHEELRASISMCLQKCNSAHTFNLVESSELAKFFGFRVDEDSEECQEGKTGALKVMELLKGEDISQIKAKFLPCQGKLWQEWSTKNKQQYCFYGDVEQTKSRVQEEMQSIRNQQRETTHNSLIKAVCENLNSNNIAKKVYFVKWLGVCLDGLFLQKHSEIIQKYYKQLSDVHLLKQKRQITDDFRKKLEELEKLSEKVDAVTFGLEHIVREMGQIYEAWAECPDRMKAEVSILPVVAADLLISGHPLELMDGDAAHVPLTWIESVLDKVTERLGDQRVFVLSVLGLQSSGKSTMLNAMFGLQFAVSAGRCTRGAFMQLTRVKEEVKEQLNFDFLLVVDTEGLQSLQLVGKQSGLPHDNELATFVTGLADLTLINIFGENPAEMKDILQIVVQAFLRMKKVKLTPSCMFVHQNIADISAGEKNMEGRSQLQKQLDEMTHLAATQEACSAEYFTDVIKFNIQTDVHYFAQLWEGNPPMAPPNPRYSENIEILKQAILKAAAGKKCLKLSELKARIKDLWTAVLNEDFVFSFKNTLEIAAYMRLESMYVDWTWELRENMLFAENNLHKRIDNGKLEAIDQKNINEETSNTFSAVKNKMKKFFNEDKDSDVLFQWKVRTEQKIKYIHDMLTETTARKFTDLCKLKTACKMQDDKKTHYENELFNRSKDLAFRLKDKAMNETSLRREFDSVWEKWLSDLNAEVRPIRDVHVEQDVMNILSSFFERRTIYSSRHSGDYKQMYDKKEYFEYVTVKKQLMFFSYTLNTEDHDSIRELVQETVREAEEIIRTKPVDRTGYSDAYTQEIVNCVKKRVAEFKAERFTLKNEFTVDLSLFVCDIAVRKFTDLHKVFREANDPVIYLGNKKGDFFSIFKKQCGGATTTAVFADFVCNKLKSSILQSVYDQTVIDAAGEMRANFPAFSGNRSNLEKHILQDLAEAESFERFITYIKNPKKHFSDFIETKFKEQMLEGENPRILEILRNTVKMKQSSVFTAIQKATQETEQKKDVNEWLKRFSLELEGEVIFTVNVVERAHYQEITDTDFFGEVMNKTLQSVFNETTSRFAHKSSVRMNIFRLRPEDILMKQLCGCWVQCPLCAAICTNTLEGHDGDHSVPFHRPGGVNGWSCHKTENLSVDICTSLVATDLNMVLSDGRCVPYKRYWEAGPEYSCWSITPDASEQPYWKWFVCRFQKDLEKHYGKTFQRKGEIPTAWRTITKQDAIETLHFL